ncbi:MAG: DUF4410 domain-containing protein [Planctomycetia bacterium]|nr:DUF4410 domain-containing protein [Planctomycetia bacterium]
MDSHDSFPIRSRLRRWSLLGFTAMALSGPMAFAQQPFFGPTDTVNRPGATAWPATPPARIYVVPFAMQDGLAQQLEQQANSSLIPQGPVRKMFSARPRVSDIVTGNDRSQPVGLTISKMVADELFQAGLPVVFWTNPGPPPADGWKLSGQIVALDEGNAVAKKAIGFGAGNKTIGVDAAMSDPSTGGGQPFFILDSSDKGRMVPGTVPIAVIAGFNPIVVAGKVVVSNSGIADISQQNRMADDIARSVAETIRLHGHFLVR